MQAMPAHQRPAGKRLFVADRAAVGDDRPAPVVGRENFRVVARLHDTAATEPGAVLGVLTYWASRQRATVTKACHEKYVTP